LLFKNFFEITLRKDDIVLRTLGTVRLERRWRSGISIITTDGQNWINIKGQRKKSRLIHIITKLEYPNTGTHKLIILDAGDTLRASIAAGMNLVLEINTNPGYGI
jgi:hypothetical protein